MINILFVDDEPNILDGLKRMLRPMRREWEMRFALGGEEALNVLAEKEIDVVVSDMKMPGIDGARLLHEVKTNYPQIVRIILSGYSEKEMVIKSVGTAHQYLSKPCDAEVLKKVVSHTCQLRDLLTDEKLRRLVSKLNSIPSLPTLYNELMKELENDDPNMRKIGQIVTQDIGMTVKILQIVNSSFFGLRRTISDANQAINYLGLDLMSSLALGIGVFSQFEGKNQTSATLSKLWNQSIVVANLAKAIAKDQNPEIANDAFTAGLLHEIGKVVLAVNLPEEVEKVEELKTGENLSEPEAERRIFQTTHAEIGAYLLGLWGLPHRVVEAVAFHHNPTTYPTNVFTPLTALYIANVFYYHGNEDIFAEPEKYFDVEYLERTGVKDKIKIWHQEFINTINNT